MRGVKLQGDGPNPSGLCQCGCGERAPLANQGDSRCGDVAGKPRRFLPRHHKRKSVAPACGYTIDSETGCWLWALGLDRNGYGRVKRLGLDTHAHIALYEDRYGPVPEGLELDHLCRNVGCCNPEHMEAVTPTENKRRSRATKLTKETVRAIRASAEPHDVVASRFGVSASTIYQVRTYRRWCDVGVAA